MLLLSLRCATNPVILFFISLNQKAGAPAFFFFCIKNRRPLRRRKKRQTISFSKPGCLSDQASFLILSIIYRPKLNRCTKIIQKTKNWIKTSPFPNFSPGNIAFFCREIQLISLCSFIFSFFILLRFFPVALSFIFRLTLSPAQKTIELTFGLYHLQTVFLLMIKSDSIL